jgi:hypothetical protein
MGARFHAQHFIRSVACSPSGVRRLVAALEIVLLA